MAETYTAETAARLLSYAEGREAMLGRSGSEHAADLRAVLAEVERLQSDAVEDPEVVRSLRAEVARLTRERDEAQDAVLVGDRLEREERVRLTAAALTGILAHPTRRYLVEEAAVVAVDHADAALAALSAAPAPDHLRDLTKKVRCPRCGGRKWVGAYLDEYEPCQECAAAPAREEQEHADVAQLVERPVRNQEVAGSSPAVSSPPARRDGPRWIEEWGDWFRCSECSKRMARATKSAYDAHEAFCWRPRVAEQEPEVRPHRCPECKIDFLEPSCPICDWGCAYDLKDLRPRPTRADAARDIGEPPHLIGAGEWKRGYRNGWRDARAKALESPSIPACQQSRADVQSEPGVER